MLEKSQLMTKTLMIDLLTAQQVMRREDGGQYSYGQIWQIIQDALRTVELNVRLGFTVSEKGNHTYHLKAGTCVVAWFYIGPPANTLVTQQVENSDEQN
jgi:hypothetical protein